MTDIKNKFIIVWGLIEMFVFSGVIFGWDEFETIYKDGLDFFPCNETWNISNNSSSECNQKLDFQIVFSFAALSKGIAALAIAKILETWGLRVSRIMANVFLLAGGLILYFATKETSWWLLPGIVCLGLGGAQMRLNNFSFSDLYPKYSSTIVTLYSGAFCASAAVPLLFTVGIDIGRPQLCQELILGWTVVSLVMLIPTFWLLPKDKIQPPVDEYAPLLVPASQEEALVNGGVVNGVNCNGYGTIDPEPMPTTWSDCTESICSISFMFHVYYGTMMGLALMVFNGEFHSWNHRVVETHPDFKVNLHKIYGYSQLLMLVLGPITGLMMDKAKNWATKAPTPDAQAYRDLIAGAPALLFCWLNIMLMIMCQFFNDPAWISGGLALFILARPTVNAVNPGYLKIRFKREHFNYLVALQGTVITILSLVQLIFYSMMSAGYLIQALSILAGLTFLGISNPFHLFCLAS